MRGNLALGLVQGFLLPLPRPNPRWLSRARCSTGARTDPLRAGAWSASSMWTANAATVSPAPDTADGRCHLTPANLVTMPHRSQEWPDTKRQLQAGLRRHARTFAVHDARCRPASAMRARPTTCACAKATTRRGWRCSSMAAAAAASPRASTNRPAAHRRPPHGLDPARVLFVEQNPEAIAAGAFHNDVVAVANERVLFTHEWPSPIRQGHLCRDPRRLPRREWSRCPPARSAWPRRSAYLFNAQLLTLPSGRDGAGRPDRMPESPACGAGRGDAGGERPDPAGNPGRRAPVDGQWRRPGLPAAAGGGDPATVDPRFLLDEAKADAIER
jgi:succinylarginine dihydrolase